MPERLVLDQLLKSDLLIGPVGYGLPAAHDVLFRDRFVCVLDARNPRLAGQPDVLALLGELPHAVGRFGESIATPADRLLDELGVRRHVAATVGGLLPLPLLVRGTDLIALVPARLARRFVGTGGIAVLELPGSERTPLSEAVYWHPSRTADPALQWLRTTLIRAGRDLDLDSAALASARRIPGSP